MTSKVKDDVLSFQDDPDQPSCTIAIRADAADARDPVSKAPLGVADIDFVVLPSLSAGGPPAAVVNWRPKPPEDSFDQRRTTTFIEQDGSWLVYRCCP
ncbi:MAG: hypothetical protein ACR2LK_13415 [Solirubrobacteraceae bacterium]